MRRLSAPYAVLAVLVIAGIALPAVSTAAAASPAQGLAPAPTAGITPATSSNWAGYGAVGSATLTVTKISASWVEPTLKCTSTTAIAVFWVGIDGMVSTAPSVEQVGTIGECVGGVASYAAWWEVYPVNAIQVISTITVSPGDHFTASVTYSTTTLKFAMKITDTTTGATFTKDKAYSKAMRETAECIAERPSGSSGLYPLANFGTATFTDCKATISGTSAGIGTFATVYEITMATSVHSLAVPSALTGSTTFTVTWKHSS
jgi:hypothetical protein